MNRNRLLAIVLTLQTALGGSPAAAKDIVAMPVTVNRQISDSYQVEVDTKDGMEVFAVRASQLIENIRKINRPIPETLLNRRTDFVSIDELRAMGFYCRYDEEKVQIEVNLPIDRDRPEPLPIMNTGDILKEGENLAPATVSGYINTSATAGFRRDRHSRTYGDQTTARFDGVFNFKGYILEGSGTARDSEPFQRDDIRLTKEIDYFDGMRISAGDLYYPVRGFQSYRKLGGVSAYSIRDQKQGYLSGKASNRLLEVRQPSILTFFVNEQAVATRKVLPGLYDVTEIPMATGVNRIRVLVEAEGSGEKESIVFDDFMSGYGIKKGQRDFAIAVGDKSTDEIGSRTYHSENRTLMASHRYDFSNQYSSTQYFQGDSKAQLYGLIQAYHVAGGYIEGDTALSYWNSEPGFGARLGYFKTEPDKMNLLKGDRYSINLERKFSGFGNIDTRQINGASTLSTSYAFPQWKQTSLSMGASYGKTDNTNEENYTYSSSLTKAIGEISLSANATQQYYTYRPNEFSIGISFNWTPGERSYYMSASKSGPSQTTAHIAMNTTRDQDVKGSITTTNDESSKSISTQVTGTTNRNEMTFTGNRIDSHVGDKSFAEHFTFNTRFALAFANTKVAIGRPIGDSFFLTDSKRNNRKYRIETWGRHAETGPMGEALLGFQNYQNNSARVFSGEPYGKEFDNNGVFNVEKSYKTGYLLKLKEKVAPTVISFQVDRLDEIESLVARLINNQTEEVFEFLVSSEGEIFVEGIESGEYTFELGKYRGRVKLDEAGGRKVFSLGK